MKSLKFLTLLIGAACMTLFTGCPSSSSGDDDTTPPTVTVTKPTANQQIARGGQLDIDISATDNESTLATGILEPNFPSASAPSVKITPKEWTLTASQIANAIKFTPNGKTGTLKGSFTVPTDAVVGDYKFNVKVTDAAGNTGTGTVTFKVIE